VIFDCDGVLVDTEIVAARIAVENLNKYNVDITVEEYISNHSGSITSLVFKKLLPQIEESNLRAMVEGFEISVYDSLEPIHGMKDVIRSINLPKSVVSNSRLWQVEKAMNVTDLGDQFKNLFSSEMVPNPKPHPDVYLLAAKTNQVEPSECLVVEDSKSGATSALEAGMKVIGFTGGSHILEGHGDDLIKKGVASVANTPQNLLLEINKFIS